MNDPYKLLVLHCVDTAAARVIQNGTILHLTEQAA
jgi:hypothetical protein